jgi:serine O-acetyltransferase
VDMSQQHLTENWTREQQQWRPAARLLLSIRDWQRVRHKRGPLGWTQRKWAMLRHVWWSVRTSSDIPLRAQIAGGLVLAHTTGTVISPLAVIGPNCTFMAKVTLGERESRRKGSYGAPTLGAGVEVGDGAAIIGPCTIGAGARIGAHAVVMCDVPAGWSAKGNPATLEPPRS